MRNRKETTIEERVADTLLEAKITVQAGGETFEVAPPTLATLILVSKCITRMPHINQAEGGVEILQEVLRTAKDCEVVAEIAAILILGAKGLTEKRFFGWIKKDRKKELTDFILYNASPREHWEMLSLLLGTTQAGDFFGCTTFLSGINLLKPTKEPTRKVVKETTASGQ